MKIVSIALAATLAASAAVPALADSLRMDAPVTLNGIETVCTGIGSSKDNPAWAQYPIRVEFSNGGTQYLAGAHVSLSGKRGSNTTFECDGAWVLLKLPAGVYRVTAAMESPPDGQSASANFFTSGRGPQKRIELRFPRLAANQ